MLIGLNYLSVLTAGYEDVHLTELRVL